RKARPCHSLPENVSVYYGWRRTRRRRARSGRNRFTIGRLPAPSARAIAASRYALLVDLRDHFAVTGKERLGRTHLGAKRQLAFGKAVGAVLLVLRLAAVRLRTTGAVRALVHFAARTEIADFRILGRAERAGIEAVAAADAQVFAVQHDGVGGG